MNDWLYLRFRPHYVVLMHVLTRIYGSVGGVLVLYYVLLSTSMPESMQFEIEKLHIPLVVFAVTATVPLALWNTRHLRKVLRLLDEGRPLPQMESRLAIREAVRFPFRQNLGEAILVPICAVVPMCGYLWWKVDAPLHIYFQVTIAAAMAITGVLLITFFASESWMRVVILDLLQQGVEFDTSHLPMSRIRTRMVVCFSLVIMLSAIMIGALANRRAMDLIEIPGQRTESVLNLRQHLLAVTAISLIVGVIYSRLLADSVSSRVNRLVVALKRVQEGDLTQRLQPTGMDEIDTLARQFNGMVGELERQNRTVRDLNVNLERKVRQRTGELARSKRFLQESIEQLRESNRHKTEFFSNVSHEFRTPLMMILSPIEQLIRKEGASLSRESRSLLSVTEVNAHRLLRLINQLLDSAKIEAGHTQLNVTLVDMNGLVERLATAAGPLVEQRGLRLRTQLSPSLSTVAGDEEKLDIILTNLISNAIKFTPRGGEIWISTDMVSPGNSVFDQEQVRVSVDDTGVGIDPANFDRLFERFVQVDGSTSREFTGTGLGLALVKEFVELHQGAVDVESQPGSGSRFSFSLPVRALSAVQDAARESSSQLIRAERFSDLQECETFIHETNRRDQTVGGDATRRENWTILVVDDTAEVRQIVGAILSERYRVIYASDGDEGLQAVKREAPDLIISDVMMPGIDGYEFCRRIRQDPDTSGIPFVLLTARAKVSMKIEGLNCGADDYLVKPFDAEELLARVRSLLRLREMHKEVSEHNDQLADTLSQLRQAQDQLIQSEKMNSLGQLVAGLAHEINNSINAVYNGIPSVITRTERLQNMVDAALDELGDDASGHRVEIDSSFQKIRTLANVIEEGAERTAKIVGDMKSFAHPGSESYEDFDLNHALALCVNLLDKQFRDRIRVHKEFGPIPLVRGPHGQLNQVFLNLLTNAVQAMPEGGDIFIGTGRDGDQVRVTIRDTGPGIPESIRRRIFDPFFTTKRVGMGTGLGLTISYGIVKKTGGTIECTSEEGIGTSFVVVLPVSPESPSTTVAPADANATVGAGADVAVRRISNVDEDN